MLTLRVPATIANMGPGFDSFGMALKFYNRFHISQAAQDGLSLAPGTCVESRGLSLNPGESLIFTGLARYYAEIGKKRPPLHVAVEAHVPMTRGLGSSSTAIVAGLVAGNALENHLLSKGDLLRIATELEGHPDNVAPALLGGALLCDDTGAYPLPWPDDWKIVVVVPPDEIRTDDARRVLPSALSYEDAIFNLRKASLLTYALLRRDGEAFRASLHDRLHQPYRGKLIPVFDDVCNLALTQGTFGTVISGSGSTLAIYCPASAEEGLLSALKSYGQQHAAGLKVMPLTLDEQGAQTTAETMGAPCE